MNFCCVCDKVCVGKYYVLPRDAESNPPTAYCFKCIITGPMLPCRCGSTDLDIVTIDSAIKPGEFRWHIECCKCSAKSYPDARNNNMAIGNWNGMMVDTIYVDGDLMMKYKLTIAALILMCCVVTGQLYSHVFVEHLKFGDVWHRIQFTSGITLILYFLWSAAKQADAKQKALENAEHWAKRFTAITEEKKANEQ